MADSRLQTGPRFLEPHLRQRVSEKTLKKYRDEILPFSEGPLERQYHPETAEEWDDLLVEYLYCHPALSRAKFPTLMGGVEFFFGGSSVDSLGATEGLRVGDRSTSAAHGAAGQGGG